MSFLSHFFIAHQKQLTSHYPGLTLALLERICADHVLTWHLNSKLKENLLAGVPLAHIFKQEFFYDSFFYINEHVLIPRKESELLVHELLQLAKPHMTMAEVGVGSGALSLSLLKELTVPITIEATDVSEEALAVARINAFRLGRSFSSEQTLTLLKADRLEGLAGPFDVIFSNPPYIKENRDRDVVHPQVLSYEPPLALFLPDDRYDLWFTDFFKDVYNKLKSKGSFLMEGHERHLSQQKKWLEQCGFSQVVVVPDLTGRDRFLKGVKEHG